ncbi:MAG: hypothetical protein HUU32_17500 [Calditrichaceae bacterium]|nr:hypothetical protein [Calditrichaceae bacterium]
MAAFGEAIFADSSGCGRRGDFSGRLAAAAGAEPFLTAAGEEFVPGCSKSESRFKSISGAAGGFWAAGVGGFEDSGAGFRGGFWPGCRVAGDWNESTFCCAVLDTPAGCAALAALLFNKRSSRTVLSIPCIGQIREGNFRLQRLQ